MTGWVGTVLYVLAMVAVVVGVDVAFFKDAPWPRLAVNVGIVLVFAAIIGYLVLPGIVRAMTGSGCV